MSHWLIVGGGFRGIVAALYLRREGHAVTLVEGAPFLGGVLHSDEWDGLWLDKGCHLFDNSDDRTTALMLEILGEDALPVDVRYASVTEGSRQEGLSIPDFTFLPAAERNQILSEVIDRVARGGDRTLQFANLAERLAARYGPTIVPHLDGASRKMFRAGLDELGPDALPATFFAILRIVSDEMARVLKEAPPLSNLIAARSQDDPMQFYRDRATLFRHRNFYPGARGMRGFCERAADHLRRLGVVVRLGAQVEGIAPSPNGLALAIGGRERIVADRALWTLESGILARLVDGDSQISALVHKTPMVLYFFRLPPERVGSYTYIQDFTADHLVFRTSAPGLYGRQVAPDGATYICVEVVTDVGSSLWNDPDGHVDAIWTETVALGQAHGRRPAAVKILKTPASYRLPKPGYAAAEKTLRESLGKISRRLVLAGQSAFGKDDIIDDIRTTLEAAEAFRAA